MFLRWEVDGLFLMRRALVEWRQRKNVSKICIIDIMVVAALVEG